MSMMTIGKFDFDFDIFSDDFTDLKKKSLVSLFSLTLLDRRRNQQTSHKRRFHASPESSPHHEEGL